MTDDYLLFEEVIFFNVVLNHRFIIAAGNPILFDKTMIETSNLILYFFLFQRSYYS